MRIRRNRITFKEYYINSLPVDSKITRTLLLLLIFPLSIIGYLSTNPIAGIYCLFLITNPSLKSFTLFLIAVFIEIQISLNVKYIQVYRESKELDAYLMDLMRAEIKLMQYIKTSWLNSKQKSLYNYFFGAYFEEQALGKMYVLVPPSGLYVSQFKGFTIPDFLRNTFDASEDRIYSMIFTPFRLDRATDLQKFLLYHELGHLTQFAIDLHKRIAKHFYAYLILFVLLLTFMIQEFGVWLIFLIPLAILGLKIGRKNTIEENEETICDKIGLLIYREGDHSNIVQLFQSLRRLISQKRCSSLIEFAFKYDKPNFLLVNNNSHTIIENILIFLAALPLILNHSKLSGNSYLPLILLEIIIFITYIYLKKRQINIMLRIRDTLNKLIII